MSRILQELIKRNVVRVGLAYVVAAWTVAQVAELALDSFDAPGWIMRTVLIVMALGLPITLILAWAFELTPEGIKKEEDVDRSQPPVRGIGRKLDFVIIGLLAVALAYFVTDKVTQQPADDIAGSIAVLPFVNRSVENDAQYFVDGMHDDLLTQLARLDDLKVISRTSVLEYRDTRKNMRQIGQELGVDTLLEGAVQRSGTRVRINAQLIDAKTDKHLWAKSFDRKLSPANVLDIQSEIARAIAIELAATLLPKGTNDALDQAPTLNQEAYDLYLQARAIPFDGPVDDLWHGIELAKRAIELDPDFALAMSQVAENYVNIYWFSTQREEHRDAAKVWIERALAIAPDDPRLQLLLAEHLYTGYLDYDAALAALDKAERGMPGKSRVYLNRGAILRRMGDIAGAIEAFDKAQLFDPRDVATAAHHIFTFLYTGDVAGARRQGERVGALPAATSVHISFTRYVDLFLLGDTTTFAKMLERRPIVDLGPENHLRTFVPFLERRYEDSENALTALPDPIVAQHSLWTHSFVRARLLHAQGEIGAAREKASFAVAELNQIAQMMPGNARPIAARALMQAILGEEKQARADIELAARLYPVTQDRLDGPNYIAEGLRALAVFAKTEELAQALERYLSLEFKIYYIDYLLLDPVFDRHRNHPAIEALRVKYSLRDSEV